MKHYTWEEKIESLVTLAKAVGKYTDVETECVGVEREADGYKEAWRQLEEAYEDFCQWRHDEPYIVDEIKALLKKG